MKDEYVTVSVPTDCETVIKGSRFIACVRPCRSEEELDGVLAEIRSRYPGATHYCFAALFDGIERFSDNGEPSGTAGRPMMQALRGSGLENTAVAVVRYFGGTLLGTGGLVQAYSGTSADVLNAAERVTMVLCRRVRFSVGYPEYNRFLSECSGFIVGKPFAAFSDAVELTVSVPSGGYDDFLKAVTDICRGDVHFAECGSAYEADVRDNVK